MSLAQKLITVLQSDNQWKAFIAEMPEQLQSRQFTSNFLDVTPGPVHEVFHNLLVRGAITDTVFMEYYNTLTKEEAIELLTYIYKKNRITRIITMDELLVPIANEAPDSLILKGYGDFVKVAIKQEDFDLLKRILTLKLNIAAVTHGLYSNGRVLGPVLQIVKEFALKQYTLEEFYTILYDNCYYEMLDDIILYITQQRGISIKDFFLEVYKPDEGAYSSILSFHLAGLKPIELVEINTQLNDTDIANWLIKNYKEEV